MGFTVAGPDRFLGCGHPDLRENLPALLGLMESTDRGQTWHSLSLLGEVDFHAIEAKHGQVYGYDATSETFLVSPDGRTWQRRAQVPLADYTVAPTRADLVLATGKAGLLRSTDEGRSFLSLPAHRGSTYWTGPTVACSGSQPTVRSGSAATPGTAGSGAVTSAANRKQSPWPAMAGSSPQASTTSPSPPTAAEASPQSSATRAVAPVTRDGRSIKPGVFRLACTRQLGGTQAVPRIPAKVEPGAPVLAARADGHELGAAWSGGAAAERVQLRVVAAFYMRIAIGRVNR